MPIWLAVRTDQAHLASRMRSLIRGSLFAGVAIAGHSSSMRRTSVAWLPGTSARASKR